MLRLNNLLDLKWVIIKGTRTKENHLEAAFNRIILIIKTLLHNFIMIPTRNKIRKWILTKIMIQIIIIMIDTF